MSLTQYYTATTLDGFIADPDDSLEWLFKQEHDKEGFGNYDAFIAGVGALAMGRTTYEWIVARHDWTYEQPCWVFTNHEPSKVPDDAPVHFTRGDVRPVHAELLEAAGGRNIWIVGGGDLVGQFADAGLLDEVLVSIAPVTLGAGKPLLPRVLDLRLEDTGRNGDFVVARYSVPRDG